MSPRLPAGLSVASDYERLAATQFAPDVYAYIAGGSGDDLTVTSNQEALQSYRLQPRISLPTTLPDLSWCWQSETKPHPFIVAPTAQHRLVHPQAEIETAHGANASDAIFTVSTLSSLRLEDIAAATPAEKWFQLYWQGSRDATLALMRRAEHAGYTAIICTLDANIQLPSRRAINAGFVWPAACVAANIHAHGAASSSPRLDAVLLSTATMDDWRWLRQQTTLAMMAKGILHPDDARLVHDVGFDAIVVSNHGGRTIDGVMSALTALPRIRAAVPEKFPVIFDSGIRSGRDAFVALALGADALMIGRLSVYALGIAGALGVAHVLRLLQEELRITMSVCGCASLADIHADCVI